MRTELEDHSTSHSAYYVAVYVFIILFIHDVKRRSKSKSHEGPEIKSKERTLETSSRTSCMRKKTIIVGTQRRSAKSPIETIYYLFYYEGRKMQRT